MAEIGLQLYTLRDTHTEFEALLRRVRAIGYEGVEFAGYGNMTVAALRTLGETLGLRYVSTHLGYETLQNDRRAVIDEACGLGLEYVVCPGVPESARNSRDAYLQLAELFNRIGRDCQAAGLKFGYHNHSSEFDEFDGTKGLDLLFENTDPNCVQFELDVFWVEKAGYKATDYLNRYAGRCELIHIKDMTRDERQTFAEVGYGRLNIPELVATAEAAGVRWLLVEQDACEGDPWQSVTMSYDYLRALHDARRNA
jgi:sugar phosphate isomerase/epimerase